MPQTFYLEKEMGKKLGRSEILQRKMQKDKTKLKWQ